MSEAEISGKRSGFTPQLAALYKINPGWLATGKGVKELGEPAQVIRQFTPPDPVLSDLSALDPEQAEMWKDRLDEALARVKRIKSEIRAAAKQARQQQEKSNRRDDKPGDCSNSEQRRASN